MKASRFFLSAMAMISLVVSGPAAAPAQEREMQLLAKPQRYRAARESSYARNGGNTDTVKIPAGGAEVTLAEILGPGAITHIWNTFRGNGRDLILRIYWEGSPHPSVEAPIGDFFGVAMGINAPVSSFPVQSTSAGRARNCWWHMPFNKSARVTASNVAPEGREIELYFYIDYARYEQPDGDISYFHARFLETDPAERGRPVLLAEAEGEGHFVGVVMGQRARTPGWFGEGDDIITVDGKTAFLGTGTEDYFCDAWGFRVFSDFYYGVPVYEGREIGHRLSAYRFHIVDPIPFAKSFKFEIEHWPWTSPRPNTGRDYYSSLGFWYQTTIHKAWPRLQTILSHAAWDPAKGRWHVPGAIEAEDLGLLGWRSTALEDRSPIVPITDLERSSREIVRSLLRYGPRPAPLFLMPNYSGDHILVFDAGGENGEFTLGVPCGEEGRYDVRIDYVPAESHGTIQLYVNGTETGSPVDISRRTEEMGRPIWPPRPQVYPNISLKAGLNEFRFVVVSKNAASTGYRAAIDCLVLTKER